MITTVLKWRHQQTHGPFPPAFGTRQRIIFTILDAPVIEPYLNPSRDSSQLLTSSS